MESKTSITFVPGLRLAESFFGKVVQPILSQNFSQLPYGAGLLGDGSEVIGFDTVISTDHDWGPRLQIFLSESDFAAMATQINSTLEAKLPEKFFGYSVAFADRDRPSSVNFSEGSLGSPRHGIEIHTLLSFVRRELGINDFKSLSLQDWLAIPEPRLLGLTSGAVFKDEGRQLQELRESISYYPRDLWLHLISAQWARIAQEQAFVGRTGDVGDEIGSILIANRLIEVSMRLCFYIERRYVPYAKWLGSAFVQLNLASQVMPFVKEVHSAENWRVRQERLCRLFEVVGKLHSNHKIPGAVTPKVSSYFERPYLVINADEFIDSIRAQIKSTEVASLPMFGSVEQISNNPNLVCKIAYCHRLMAGLL